MKKLTVITTKSTNPYRNLALEEALLARVEEGECILYLWQNRRTVVIGRNQSALSECNVRKLLSDGGFLARRLSGGGAVYHDTGNLNFTFVARPDDFDKDKQTEVILRAVRAVGIHAEKNGRNDLTVDGRKFSGHAYYQSKQACYHHGTLMMSVDKNVLSDYLKVSPLKLQSKGVASVRSRVVNLCELNPHIGKELLCRELIAAFEQVYGKTPETAGEDYVDATLLKTYEKRYASDEWKYAGEVVLPFSAEKRFDWGQARLDFELNEDQSALSVVRFYSDGLSAEYLSQVSDRLTGCPLCREEILRRLTEGAEGFAAGELERISKDILILTEDNLREKKLCLI